jgi:uncharacterized Zn-finger protein
VAQLTRGNVYRAGRDSAVGADENDLASRPIDPPESEVVEAWRVACDGGESALGHPRVWLQIPADLGWIDCGYCDKRYIHASKAEMGESESAPGRDGPVKAHPGVP